MSKSDRGPKSSKLGPSQLPPSQLPPPPWSVPVPVAEIPEAGLFQTIEARPDERKAMAELGGLPAIAAVKAELKLLPVRGGTVHVTGRVTGRVTQTCVVSLDPVENDVDEDVDVVFAPPSQIRELAESMEEDDGERDDERPDPPEPIEDGAIDIGKLATDALFLGLDPYPRKPDAVFQDQVEAPNPDEHPFAALKALQEAPDKPKKT
ncbi:MAG: phosphodiesterase [Bradyrhizobiaceae bacterium PARB1]|jgi:uncharacterized metal-binding protein YceD (DUF177 family)|nr:MAG: phosphodiesterase [Bradyrhizobiaceae bacterium PARB1]